MPLLNSHKCNDFAHLLASLDSKLSSKMDKMKTFFSLEDRHVSCICYMFLTKSSHVCSPAWLERISLINGGSPCGGLGCQREADSTLWKIDGSQNESRLKNMISMKSSSLIKFGKEHTN